MTIKYSLFSVCAALLFILGLHPLNLTWISCLFLIPLFVIALDKNCRTKHLVLYTLITGFLIYTVTLYWIPFYSFKIYLMVILIMTPTFTIYLLAYRLLISKIANTTFRILIAFFLWILFQKLYELTPLGTAVTELPFYGFLPLFQIVSFAPFYILGAIYIGINVSIASVFQKRDRESFVWIMIFTTLIGSLYFWGNNRLKTPSKPIPPIALIQHNLPILGEWEQEHFEAIKRRYRNLALQAAEKNPKLIIFPLYSLPFDVLRDPDFFLNLAKEVKAYIMVGSYIPKEPGKGILDVGFYDTAVLYSPQGEVAGYYHATQPPPFRSIGEHKGKEYKVFDTPFGKLGVLLCYEDAAPKVAKEAVRKGADILIAISNPGHFEKTNAPYYHLLQDRLRAIESNRPVVRVSANGYSAYIDSKGRIIKKSQLGKEEILSTH